MDLNSVGTLLCLIGTVLIAVDVLFTKSASDDDVARVHDSSGKLQFEAVGPGYLRPTWWMKGGTIVSIVGLALLSIGSFCA